MLEESLDPRPHPERFAQVLAARAAERGLGPAELARWLGTWHDREGAWTALRNLDHWIERGST
jgi:hypothetical protein